MGYEVDLSRSRSGRGSPCQPVKGLPLRLRLLPLQLQLHLEKRGLMLHNMWSVDKNAHCTYSAMWTNSGECQTCS